jgi:FkbM family methyltransferase
VGAHSGEYFQMLSDIGYTGRVVSFEPVQENFSALRRKARGQARWHLRKVALGAEAATKAINVYKGSVFNSFLDASQYGSERFGSMVDRIGSETVRVVRLDSVFADCIKGLESPRVFLKMDTQGWDMEVLRGASGVLDQIIGLQSELPARQCYEGMVPYTEALEQCSGLGFEVTGIFPVARDKDNLRIVEFDCVMLRQACARAEAG